MGETTTARKPPRLDGPEGSVAPRGDEVVVVEIGQAGGLRDAFDLIARLPEEIDRREDAPPQERSGL